MLSDIAMIGLAVMGENLSVNIESRGYRVSVLDVREGVTEAFVKGRGKGKNFYGAKSFEDLVSSLAKPMTNEVPLLTSLAVKVFWLT